MDIVHERAAGMDISKHDAKVCVRVPGHQRGRFTSTVTTWGATTNQILQLCRFLDEQHDTTVVMEATSDYWKPFYYLLESTLPVMLINVKTARNIPGRKTDPDASWLAQLAAHGLKYRRIAARRGSKESSRRDRTHHSDRNMDHAHQR